MHSCASSFMSSGFGQQYLSPLYHRVCSLLIGKLDFELEYQNVKNHVKNHEICAFLCADKCARRCFYVHIFIFIQCLGQPNPIVLQRRSCHCSVPPILPVIPTGTRMNIRMQCTHDIETFSTYTGYTHNRHIQHHNRQQPHPVLSCG